MGARRRGCRARTTLMWIHNFIWSTYATLHSWSYASSPKRMAAAALACCAPHASKMRVWYEPVCVFSRDTKDFTHVLAPLTHAESSAHNRRHTYFNMCAKYAHAIDALMYAIDTLSAMNAICLFRIWTCVSACASCGCRWFTACVGTGATSIATIIAHLAAKRRLGIPWSTGHGDVKLYVVKRSTPGSKSDTIVWTSGNFQQEHFAPSTCRAEIKKTVKLDRFSAGTCRAWKWACMTT